MSSTSNSNSNSLIAFSQNLADIVEAVGKSIVAINGQRFPCSGIYWREGMIVTSDENIKHETGVTITLPDGETSPVTLFGRDRSTDVAIFKSEVSLPIAPIDSNCNLKVGHLAIAIGRDKERGLFASQGIVSTVGGSWRSTLGGYIDRFIRLDLNFYPGSGGSALVNAAVGAVVAGLIVIHPELASFGESDSAITPLPQSASPLTFREVEVLQLLAAGLDNKAIALKLQISKHTVKFHISSILSKLNVSSRTEAVTFGLRQGLIWL